jgi:hypothetical protein
MYPVRSLIVLMYRSGAGTSSSRDTTFSVIPSSATSPRSALNCPSAGVYVILKPRFKYTDLSYLIAAVSVGAFCNLLISAVPKLMCREIVIKNGV